MINRLIFNLCCLLTTKYCTPSHTIIILVIGETYFSLIERDFSWRVYVEYVIYALLIFTILVFLEIIEINCCGLQKNTEKNIRTRAREMDLKEIDDDQEEEKEDE